MYYYEAFWNRREVLNEMAYKKWESNKDKSAFENWKDAENELLNIKPPIIFQLKKYMYVEKNISFKDINENKEFFYNGSKYCISDRKLTQNYLIAILVR